MSGDMGFSEKKILPHIHSPNDLKELTADELEKLASEIRERIVSVMAKNGGHLASNLGSVDFTIALHAIFSSPRDKIIFDVSHQTYAHKLLTGRNDDRFDLIRKSGGLSGFAHPKESIHDHFFAGHAGTALSLALGMAHARDLARGEEHIIAVIGDASLTCGLTFEALNNICRSLKRFIVILNDNAMSISHNVGGITNILSRVLSNPKTCRLKRGVSDALTQIPAVGPTLVNQARKLASSMKNLVSSAPFFEQFGLSYIGPLDGHDLKKLLSVIEGVKNLEMPVLVHLYTKKGYGLKKAEQDPITYHGVKPFNPMTCEFLPSPPSVTFPTIFGQEIVKMGQEDPHLWVITPATSVGAALDSFMNRFKERSWDVGIAEGHAVTFAAGLAKGKKGAKVICSIYSTFLQRAFDNLFHDVCLQGLPILFAIDRAGMAAADGATHHGIYDLSFLKAMPQMVICQPRDGDLLRQLLRSAHLWQHPVAIRYPNLETTATDCAVEPRALGKGDLIAEGNDVVIVALGHMVKHALQARELLMQKGVSVAIVDPVFIKPLDEQLLNELFDKHDCIVTVEEHVLTNGFGASIARFLHEGGFRDKQLLTLGIPDTFFDHKSYSTLLDEFGLSATAMASRIMEHFTIRSKTFMRSFS